MQMFSGDKISACNEIFRNLKLYRVDTSICQTSSCADETSNDLKSYPCHV